MGFVVQGAKVQVAAAAVCQAISLLASRSTRSRTSGSANFEIGEAATNDAAHVQPPTHLRKKAFKRS